MNYLVVGGSTGIGKEISDRLLEEGHNVIVASRSATTRLSSSGNLSVHDVDATEPDADWSFLPESLDGVVYCGGSINLKPFKRLKNEDFIQDYTVNVLGAVNSVQAC